MYKRWCRKSSGLNSFSFIEGGMSKHFYLLLFMSRTSFINVQNYLQRSFSRQSKKQLTVKPSSRLFATFPNSLWSSGTFTHLLFHIWELNWGSKTCVSEHLQRRVLKNYLYKQFQPFQCYWNVLKCTVHSSFVDWSISVHGEFIIRIITKFTWPLVKYRLPFRSRNSVSWIFLNYVTFILDALQMQKR